MARTLSWTVCSVWSVCGTSAKFRVEGVLVPSFGVQTLGFLLSLLLRCLPPCRSCLPPCRSGITGGVPSIPEGPG